MLSLIVLIVSSMLAFPAARGLPTTMDSEQNMSSFCSTSESTNSSDAIMWKGWWVDDTEVTVAFVGEKVTAKIRFYYEPSGYYRIRIMRDIEWAPDEEVAKKEFNYGGGDQEYSLSFTPTIATGEDNTRGYHVDVYKKEWWGWAEKWTMEDSYPPRLRVYRFDFGISASPYKRTIAQGESATYDITVSLTSGVSQLVSLSVIGLPSGTSASFEPNSGYPPFNSKLTVKTSSSTSTGTYKLKIKGTGGGKEHSTDVELEVIHALPQYKEGKFKVGATEGRQIVVAVYSEVTTYIKLYNPYTVTIGGTVKVEIKKDIVGWPDEVYRTLTKMVTIPSKSTSSWIDMGTFIADVLTGDSLGQVRQYYIKVYWDNYVIYDPTDPNVREWVKTSEIPLSVNLKSPPDNTIVYQSPIKLEARVTSDGASVQGALVKFYVNDQQVGSDTSDGSGYVSLNYYPPNPGSYTWYCTAEKVGYKKAKSETWDFTYKLPEVEYLATRFEGADKSGAIISVPVGTLVEVYIKIRIVGATISGILKVEIRKDIPLGTDVTIKTLTRSISKAPGEYWIHMGNFEASELTDGFRQYYNRVWFDSKLTFDPTDPNTRPHVTTYRIRTILTLESPPQGVMEGEELTFTGRLVTEDGVAISGATIYVYDSDPDWDDLIVSGTTRSDGSYSIKWTAKPMDPTDQTVEIYAKFEGTTNYAPSRSPETGNFEIVVVEKVELEVYSLSTDKEEYGPYDLITFQFKVKNIGDRTATYRFFIKYETPKGQRIAESVSDKTYSLEPGCEEIISAERLPTNVGQKRWDVGTYKWGVCLTDSTGSLVIYVDTCFVDSFKVSERASIVFTPDYAQWHSSSYTLKGEGLKNIEVSSHVYSSGDGGASTYVITGFFGGGVTLAQYSFSDQWISPGTGDWEIKWRVNIDGITELYKVGAMFGMCAARVETWIILLVIDETENKIVYQEWIQLFSASNPEGSLLQSLLEKVGLSIEQAVAGLPYPEFAPYLKIAVTSIELGVSVLNLVSPTKEEFKGVLELTGDLSVKSGDKYRWVFSIYTSASAATLGTYTAAAYSNMFSTLQSVEVLPLSPDSTPPETELLTYPESVVTVNNVFFSWGGSDDQTFSDQLLYSYWLVGYDDGWSPWGHETSKTYKNLPEGIYVFKVRAKDKAGNVDPTPAKAYFVIDTTPPEYSDASPVGGMEYDSYMGSIRLQITWNETESYITFVKFRYKYEDQAWSEWFDPSGSSSDNYWFDIPREEWIKYVGRTIYWQSYATNGGGLIKYTNVLTGLSVVDDDTIPPKGYNPQPPNGRTYTQDYPSSIRIQVTWTDGVSKVRFYYRYLLPDGQWKEVQPSGHSGNTYWYDIPRSEWINYIGTDIQWYSIAWDNDNDRPNDQASAQHPYPPYTIHLAIKRHNTQVEIISGCNTIVDRSPPITPHNPLTVTFRVKVKDLETGQYLINTGTVEFYVDGKLIGTDNDANADGIYEITWDPPQNWPTLGTQTWQAKFTGTPFHNPSQKSCTITIYGQLYQKLLSPHGETYKPGDVIKIAVQVTSDNPAEDNIKGCKVIITLIAPNGMRLAPVELQDPDNDGIYTGKITVDWTILPGWWQIEIHAQKPNYHDCTLPPEKAFYIEIPERWGVDISIEPTMTRMELTETATFTIYVPKAFWYAIGGVTAFLIILMGFVFEPEFGWTIISIFAGGLTMVLGYFLYEQLILGVLAVAEIPINIGQMLVGLIVATPVTKAIRRYLGT